jgi:potassium/chloride transporter 4/5/6
MMWLALFAIVNAACFSLSWSQNPKFTPNWSLHHWATPLLGFLLCSVLMFYLSWEWGIVAAFISLAAYKLIGLQRAGAAWGESYKGLGFQSALSSIFALDEIKETHTRNWRPQVLCLVALSDTDTVESAVVKDASLMSVVHTIKGGRGLNMVGNVIVSAGSGPSTSALSTQARYSLLLALRAEGITGFCDVLISPSLRHGMLSLIQTAGLGGLKPNTVVMGFPERVRFMGPSVHGYRGGGKDAVAALAPVVSLCGDFQRAVIIVRGADKFPRWVQGIVSTIDVWWLAQDGGLLLLLAKVLSERQTFSLCRLRVFSVARRTDNSLQLREDLVQLLRTLKLDGEVMDPITFGDDVLEAFSPGGRFLGDHAKRIGSALSTYSSRSGVVLVNLPAPRREDANEEANALEYASYLDVMTAGVPRALLVRGCGLEVVENFHL